MSDILGPAPSLRLHPQLGDQSLAPRTTYAETVVGGSHSARVPDVPEESKQLDTFECPYCHLELDSAAMRDRMTWKRHVFRDLRPYTCLHPTCPNRDKLYATRHDWIYHEMQMHRRQWTCSDCDLNFFSSEGMKSHLSSEHPSATSSQIPEASQDTLLGLYEQAMDKGVAVSCPLCQKRSGLKLVLVHLGQHMEQLSLFVLPRPETGVEGEDGEMSNPDEASQDGASQDADALPLSFPGPPYVQYQWTDENIMLFATFVIRPLAFSVRVARGADTDQLPARDPEGHATSVTVVYQRDNSVIISVDISDSLPGHPPFCITFHDDPTAGCYLLNRSNHNILIAGALAKDNRHDSGSVAPDTVSKTLGPGWWRIIGPPGPLFDIKYLQDVSSVERTLQRAVDRARASRAYEPTTPSNLAQENCREIFYLLQQVSRRVDFEVDRRNLAEVVRKYHALEDNMDIQLEATNLLPSEDVLGQDLLDQLNGCVDAFEAAGSGILSQIALNNN